MTTIHCHCGRNITATSVETAVCACGVRYTIHGNTEAIAVPDGYKPTAEKLGDFTERQLKSIGVTKERYKAAKELFGLAPTCGCDARKQWLNSVSDWWRGS